MNTMGMSCFGFLPIDNPIGTLSISANRVQVTKKTAPEGTAAI
jgi:hypothetical protein